MHITLLHTVPSAIPAYEAACPAGVTLAHHVRSDLRYLARDGITPRLRLETAAHLKRLSQGSDAVLVTCDLLAAATEPPALSADLLLAQEVDRRALGKTVEVFCAWPGSVPHLEAIFARLERPSAVTVTCIPGLWESQNALEIDRHDCLIRKAVSASPARIIAVASPMMLRAVEGDGRLVSITEAAIAGLQDLPRRR
jgi:hypothetical protein